jgi:hypothetical protein
VQQNSREPGLQRSTTTKGTSLLCLREEAGNDNRRENRDSCTRHCVNLCVFCVLCVSLVCLVVFACVSFAGVGSSLVALLGAQQIALQKLVLLVATPSPSPSSSCVRHRREEYDYCGRSCRNREGGKRIREQ